jgi:xanthine dehydrogenase YagR molybdenum-binding subunit
MPSQTKNLEPFPAPPTTQSQETNPLPLIGAPVDRADAILKVTGRAVYAAEPKGPDLVHAVIVQSLVSKGKITDIDSQAAEQSPGVVAVLTYKNAPKFSKATAGSNGNSQSPGVHLMLQSDAVLFWGQHVGVVLADTFEHARLGASRLKIGYEGKAAKVDMNDVSVAYQPQNKLKGTEWPDSARGDADQAFTVAPVKIDSVYITPTENHNPMEPHATTAVWDHGKLTLYDATQFISGVRSSVAAALDLKPEDVRVICRYVGGGFGSKGATWPHVVLAAASARYLAEQNKTGRAAVRLELTRAQMFTSVGRRSQTNEHIKLAATPDGKLTGIRHDSINQTATYGKFIETAALATRMLYSCPNVATTHRLVTLDTIVPTYQRAPGESVGVCCLECAMDELAYELKLDPLALRLKNYAEKDEDRDLPFSSKSLRQCYQQAAERFGWSKRSMAVGSQPVEEKYAGWKIGWGMATATYPMNRFNAGAKATLCADGSAIIQAGSQDLGTGTYTVQGQVAAAALGLPVEKVRVQIGDSIFPPSGVSGGSSTTASLGPVVQTACNRVVKKLADIAVADADSPMHGLNAESLITSDGKLVDKGDPSKSESIADLLRRNNLTELSAEEVVGRPENMNEFSMHAFGAVFAEVRVDPIGQVRLNRIVAAYAAGRILNEKTARSQYIGGIVWGIGLAMLEETVTDSRTGKIVNNNLADYHVPVNADVPDIDIIMVPEQDSHVNSLGVKGIGEIGIVGSAAAIANAIYHATGKRVREFPITPDKLL